MNGGAKKTAILVAGMHRSGTSALTRVLNIVGCDLPGVLVTPKGNNERGFWESRAIFELNQEIFASAGSTWDDWRPFEHEWYASPVAEEFRERAQELLQGEFGSSRLFVLKDPRICRLLRFWIEAVEAFGARPLVVVPIRSPVDVALSLEARDGIDPSVGCLIWLRNVLETESASRGMIRAWSRYEQLLSDAQTLVATLGTDLGISWPRRLSPRTEIEIDEFLSPALRHHRSDDAMLLSNPRLSHWIRDSFDILERWTRGDVREEDPSGLDRIKADFDAATPAFSRALANCRQTVLKGRAQSRKLEREVSERDNRVTSLREQVTKLEGLREEIAALREEITELERLRGVIVERDGRIETLTGELDAFRNGPVMSLARRGTRLGIDRIEAHVLLSPEWLDQVRSRHDGPLAFELRRNGRMLVRASVRDDLSGDLRIPLGFHVPSLRDAVYSLHHVSTGEAIATLVAFAWWRARRIEGAVEDRSQPEIRGWILDRSDPGRKSRVAIHVNGSLREVIVAGEQRADIARWKGTDGHHGFLWPVPETEAAAGARRIDILHADTGRPLRGSPVRVESARVVACGPGT